MSWKVGKEGKYASVDANSKLVEENNGGRMPRGYARETDKAIEKPQVVRTLDKGRWNKRQGKKE